MSPPLYNDDKKECFSSEDIEQGNESQKSSSSITHDNSSESSHHTNKESSSSTNTNNDKVVCPFNDQYSHHEYIFVVCAGLALSFNSGYINGACLSGLLVDTRQSVSAFTGAYTVSALALADSNVDLFGFQFSMILSFMAGATLAGILTPKAQAWRIAPTYGPTFLVGGCFLLIATLLAMLDSDDSKRLFYFAAAANGVQNGISSMYSSNLIRTSHLTGTSTDIGLLVGQCLRGNCKQLWKLRLLVGLATFFWLGGIVSLYATRRFTRQSLLFNTILFFSIGLALVVFLSKELGISMWQATWGSWSWQEALHKLSLYTADGRPVSAESMMDVFDKIDADGSGTIEEDELYSALKEAGLTRLSHKRVKAMMSVADENSDGLLSREEWKELVMGTVSDKSANQGQAAQ